MENNESKISINILEVLKDFLHKWWIILIASVVGACALFVYTFFTTDQKYTATAKMYVNNSSISSSISDAIDSVTGGTISSSNLQASRTLVSSYAVIMKTHLILDDVLNTAETEEKYTYDQLVDMISVGAVNGTEICYISVTCTNPNDAKLLANTTLHVFKDQISGIMNGSSARIVDYAVETSPVSRGFTKMSLIGFAVGFVLSLVAIFLIDFYINDTFQDSDALKQALPDDIPVLSIIPDTDTSYTGKYGYYKKYGHYSNDYTYSYYQETVENEEAEKEKE